MTGVGPVALLALIAACTSTEAAAPPPQTPADSTPAVIAAPPPVTLPGTEVRLLPSEAVDGVTYKLYISLPTGYADSTERYATLYLLDADYSFAIARNVVEHLSDRSDMPPMVIVGIAYDGPLRYRENRTRDYTPTFVPDGGYGPEYQRVSGGSPDFRDFLETELIPFIEREYRVGDERTLVGHSYGGLFGTWVAFTRPDLFSSYLLVSPSLWYDDRMVFGVENGLAGSGGAGPGEMYFAVGSRERNSLRDMVVDLRAFDRQVDGHGYTGLRKRIDVLEDETHNSVFPRALSNGLRWLHGWN